MHTPENNNNKVDDKKDVSLLAPLEFCIFMFKTNFFVTTLFVVAGMHDDENDG